jgi:hypothetical protein
MDLTNGVGQPGLWAKTIEVARRNFKACLTYVGIMVTIGLAEDYMSSGGGLTIAKGLAAAFLAIPAHLSVLKSDQALTGIMGTTDNKILWRFFWRAFLLGVISFAPAMIILIVLLTQETGLTLAILAMAAVLAVTAPIVFAKWGTMLPASVIDADYSFAAAGQRGKKTFGYAAIRLFVSFVVLTIAMIAVVLLPLQFSEGDGRFISSDGRPDVAAILGNLAANAIGAFQIVMTAVILSRTYLKAEGVAAA